MIGAFNIISSNEKKADREGYPEVAEAYKRIAFEEAEHAAKFAELLGEVVGAVSPSCIYPHTTHTNFFIIFLLLI